jgi:putative endopeptidase
MTLGSQIRFVAACAALLVTVPAAAVAQERHGPNRGFMDSKASPCEDFFRYANGAWYDTVSIPAAYTGVGAGREMADKNQGCCGRCSSRPPHG